VITLQPLSRAAVSVLASKLTGAPLSRVIAAKIHRLTNGNPSMVRQVCLALVAGIHLSDIKPHPLPIPIADQS
jgi:predicted ATPase